MYAGLRDVKRYSIATTDGDIGVIQDFLFDDRDWAVRYMQVDTHKWLPMGQKVLISPISLRELDENEEVIHVLLSTQQVKDSPPIEAHEPVSRAYETLFFKYFGYGYYWTGPGVWGEYSQPHALAHRQMPDMKDFGRVLGPPDDQNHLRSIEQIKGYDVTFSAENIGQVYDLIMDTESWTIKYVVVDTHRFLPGFKKVLLRPSHIDAIDWLTHRLSSHVNAEFLLHCPTYESGLLNSELYQKRVKKQFSMLFNQTIE